MNRGKFVTDVDQQGSGQRRIQGYITDANSLLIVELVDLKELDMNRAVEFGEFCIALVRSDVFEW